MEKCNANFVFCIIFFVIFLSYTSFYLSFFLFANIRDARAQCKRTWLPLGETEAPLVLLALTRSLAVTRARAYLVALTIRPPTYERYLVLLLSPFAVSSISSVGRECSRRWIYTLYISRRSFC